jgi:hypothetical protein
MARTVFFSFHYKRDIMRVQIVKNHYVTKGDYTAAGYFDGSLEEKSKKEGDDAVKQVINAGLSGSSVTCVLIGKETYTRRWVDYEILKSVEKGMGVFGIRIHQIPDARRSAEPAGGVDEPGFNPFFYLGYGRKDDQLYPMIRYESGWADAPYLSPITEKSAKYLNGQDKPVLEDLFSVYDWEDDNGYDNFADWVENAATQSGK